jgi:hypothetical protein
MQYSKPERDDRASLIALLIALDASPRSLRRDECGDYAIEGKQGHVYTNGPGYLFYVSTGSPRRWTNIKKRLAFCNITQDGDDEGCLHLDRLPALHEAGLIREALGIKRKRQLTPEAKASLANRFSQKPTGRPSDGRPFI